MNSEDRVKSLERRVAAIEDILVNFITAQSNLDHALDILRGISENLADELLASSANIEPQKESGN